MKPFDFAEPALALGFGDTVGEVVANLDKATALCRVWPENGAANVPLTEIVGTSVAHPEING